MRPFVNAGDIVVCHDPQTASLIDPLVAAGVIVIWRCHIGSESSDTTNSYVNRAWTFLEPYISKAHHCVFTRAVYVPDYIDKSSVTIIPPSIDPTSPKNQAMERPKVLSILHHLGILNGFSQVH